MLSVNFNRSSKNTKKWMNACSHCTALQGWETTSCHKWAKLWLHATGLEAGYLVVGVALRIEGGERRGWDFVQPLSLRVRPRLVIKRNLRRFYLRCTDKAQHGATHTHCGTLTGKVHCSLIMSHGGSLTVTQLDIVLVDARFYKANRKQCSSTRHTQCKCPQLLSTNSIFQTWAGGHWQSMTFNLIFR